MLNMATPLALWLTRTKIELATSIIRSDKEVIVTVYYLHLASSILITLAPPSVKVDTVK